MGKPLEREFGKWKRPRRSVLSDDEFSRELAGQGDEGKLMRLLYLNPWIKIFRHHVDDESLRD